MLCLTVGSAPQRRSYPSLHHSLCCQRRYAASHWLSSRARHLPFNEVKTSLKGFSALRFALYVYPSWEQSDCTSCQVSEDERCRSPSASCSPSPSSSRRTLGRRPPA